MTKKIDAVREVASYWRKRYSGAMAIIAELQAEREEIRDNRNDWRHEYGKLVDKLHEARRWARRMKAERDYLADRVLELHGYGVAIRAHKHQPGSGLLGPYTPPGGRFGCWVDGKPAPPYIEPSETKDTPPSFFQRTLGAVIDFIEQGNEMAALEDKFEALAAELADTPPGIPIQGVDDMYYPIERGRPGESLLGGDTVDEGRYVRRADGSFLWWSDHEREERRLYTPPADPIQGVEDMYFTGESWQTEDE